MALIVAAIRVTGAPNFESEFPVLSVRHDVDSGYIMEAIRYFISGLETQFSEFEYAGQGQDPENFSIGLCSFVKENGAWFYVSKDEDKYPIVYGQEALEAYGSGQMVKCLQERFGGPD